MTLLENIATRMHKTGAEREDFIKFMSDLIAIDGTIKNTLEWALEQENSLITDKGLHNILSHKHKNALETYARKLVANKDYKMLRALAWNKYKEEVLYRFRRRYTFDELVEKEKFIKKYDETHKQT